MEAIGVHLQAEAPEFDTSVHSVEVCGACDPRLEQWSRSDSGHKPAKVASSLGLDLGWKQSLVWASAASKTI